MFTIFKILITHLASQDYYELSLNIVNFVKHVNEESFNFYLSKKMGCKNTILVGFMEKFAEL